MTTSEPFLLDLNVLIALSMPNHVHHGRAHAWFNSISQPWATTPLTEAGYLRLCTNPSIVDGGVSMQGALASLNGIRATSGHWFLPDSSTLATPVISLERVTTSRHVTDAHLVNLAAVSGAVLATIDRRIEHILMPEDRHHLLVLP